MNDYPLILFDGVCNLCNGLVNFIIRQDQKKIFRFTTLQSATANAILPKYQLPANFDRSVLLIYKNQVYKGANAALKIWSLLPWYWQWTQIFWIVPAFIRDAVYQFISTHRYQWFGKKDSCMVPSPALKQRFLD